MAKAKQTFAFKFTFWVQSIKFASTTTTCIGDCRLEEPLSVSPEVFLILEHRGISFSHFVIVQTAVLMIKFFAGKTYVGLAIDSSGSMGSFLSGVRLWLKQCLASNCDIIPTGGWVVAPFSDPINGNRRQIKMKTSGKL